MTDGVVDFVRARVIEIFALEDQTRRVVVAHESRRLHNRRRTPDEVAQDRVVLVPERGIREGRVHPALELGDRLHENFGDELSAETGTKITARIGTLHTR